MDGVNLTAVLVAGIVATGLGAFWYSPAGFGKRWMREMRFTDAHITEMKKKGMMKVYVIHFAGALVMASILGYALMAVSAVTLEPAVGVAFMAWLGLVVPVQIASVLWEGKSWTYFAITAGYYLVSLLLMSAVFTLWA